MEKNIGIGEYPTFSESTDYLAGDIVNYQGKLYKFTDDHAIGAWDEMQVESENLNSIQNNKNLYNSSLYKEVLSENVTKNYNKNYNKKFYTTNQLHISEEIIGIRCLQECDVYIAEITDIHNMSNDCIKNKIAHLYVGINYFKQAITLAANQVLAFTVGIPLCGNSKSDLYEISSNEITAVYQLVYLLALIVLLI